MKTQITFALGINLNHNLSALKARAPKKFSPLFILLAVLALVAALLNSAPASAQVAGIVVNSTADNVKDGCTGSHCTLREAILQANSTVGIQELIEFNIPTENNPNCVKRSGVCTIQIKTPLPEITDPVIIDGSSQPGAKANTLAVGNNAKLKIVLKGKAQTFDGLVVQAPNSEIRGLVLDNFNRAIKLESDNNLVTGNFFGTTAGGAKAGAGNKNGVALAQADQSRIGGDSPAARNVISNSSLHGIFIGSSNNVQVLGNYIGTDMAGKTIVGGKIGIMTSNSGDAQIGGQTNLTRNVISGNSSDGLLLGKGTQNATVEGNYFGLGADGKVALPNVNGIRTQNDVTNVAIVKNVIANNTGIGVMLRGATTKDIRALENSIFSNGGLGISLQSKDPTPNDAGDIDGGANGLQNFPVLKQVQASALGTTIKAAFNSYNFTPFHIEYYTSPGCDSSGHGEGKTFLGSQQINTSIHGKANFSFQTPKILSKGSAVTATATEMTGSTKLGTSEFSKCIVVP